MSYHDLEDLEAIAKINKWDLHQTKKQQRSHGKNVKSTYGMKQKGTRREQVGGRRAGSDER